KKYVTLIVVSMFIISAGFTQQAQFLDRILLATELDCLGAVTLVLGATDQITDDLSEDNAWGMLEQHGWDIELVKEEPITVAEYSFLIVNAFKIKGGILYSLFPSPRYALRELKWRGVVASSLDPDEKFDGTVALYILQNAMDILAVSTEGDIK
ncbi:MAG TPA: hypothetical protein VFC68_06050, partial [Treponemataceae bacterium]|nr:hypothetical protein [Treponemataceae bacterium]